MAEREDRVRKIMESMGDLVNGHKEKELLKKLEKDYIVQCIANDEQSLAQDKRKKQMNKLKKSAAFLGTWPTAWGETEAPHRRDECLEKLYRVREEARQGLFATAAWAKNTWRLAGIRALAKIDDEERLCAARLRGQVAPQT